MYSHVHLNVDIVQIHNKMQIKCMKSSLVTSSRLLKPIYHDNMYSIARPQ